MNANPFTCGHRYLIEYAEKRVDNLYVILSSQYIISSSSLSGYFKKEDMKGDILLDATQDILSFAQVANILDVKVSVCGEEPKDLFTKRYNDNMEKLVPETTYRHLVEKYLN